MDSKSLIKLPIGGGVPVHAINIAKVERFENCLNAFKKKKKIALIIFNQTMRKGEGEDVEVPIAI